jgi:hypothetical protein
MAVVDAHRQAEHWLSSIQNSLSWRMTAPLRSLKRSLSHRPH